MVVAAVDVFMVFEEERTNAKRRIKGLENLVAWSMKSFNIYQLYLIKPNIVAYA